MAKLVRTRKLNARIDEQHEQRVNEYLASATISKGDLIREGVDEYMINHPVKVPIKPALVGIKPEGRDHGRGETI